ncbi:MAG: HlyD family type I secretion periplasmic adaptor subunit [Pseudomonadota bacterium]|nr:HlyD family type I secretion periplasmic adaptor subunit [Pseudomonadota bacterium]
MSNFEIYMQRRGNLPHRILLFLLLILIASGLLWAHLSFLDITTEAYGKIVPSRDIQAVQHLEGGIIERVHVREGDEVAAEDPLITLEATASASDFEQLRVRMASLQVDLVRLEGEISRSDVVFFPEEISEKHPDLVDAGERLFASNISHINNLVSAQVANVQQRKEELRQIRARIAKNAGSLSLLREQISISDDLLENELTNKMLHLDLLKEESELGGLLDEDEAALKRVEAALQEAEIRISTITDNYVSEARTELGEKLSLLAELSQQESKLKDNLKRTVLRAPVEGIVKTIHQSTVAGVVRPGDVIIELVPKGGRLVVEAQFPIHEIVYIQVGQAAKVRLLNPDMFSFGQITGSVSSISPDSIKTEEGLPFYKVMVELERDYFLHKEKMYKLMPGIQVSCSIITGKRTVLEYFLEPFIGTLAKAFSER